MVSWITGRGDFGAFFCGLFALGRNIACPGGFIVRRGGEIIGNRARKNCGRAEFGQAARLAGFAAGRGEELARCGGD